MWIKIQSIKSKDAKCSAVMATKTGSDTINIWERNNATLLVPGTNISNENRQSCHQLTGIFEIEEFP